MIIKIDARKNVGQILQLYMSVNIDVSCVNANLLGNLLIWN